MKRAFGEVFGVGWVIDARRCERQMDLVMHGDIYAYTEVYRVLEYILHCQ
jgi:hypothetical protein